MTTPPLLGTVHRSRGAVHLERTMPAPPARVWAALTDPVGLHAWLAPVVDGAPGSGATFVLRMNERETATCTVTLWQPPSELRLVWDYTGEAVSRLARTLAHDLRPHGSTALAISPGFTRTEAIVAELGDALPPGTDSWSSSDAPCWPCWGTRTWRRTPGGRCRSPSSPGTTA